MSRSFEEHNYIWLSSDYKKMYLLDSNKKTMNIFLEILIKKINLFVSYDKNKNYNICYYKTESNIKLSYTRLFKNSKTFGAFLNYFKNNHLNCVEFEIELIDGTMLKTFYGNDLIIVTENNYFIDETIKMMPLKMKPFFENRSNLIDNIIKHTNDSIISITPVIDLENFLMSNESYFFNT